VLSGGERNRYALLKLLLHPANFLLLDEPTNHLDMRAKDVLLEALENYTGTVVFVSHDRYFIDKLSSRVFEIGGGKVEIYPGNYEDYLWRKQGGAAELQAETAKTVGLVAVPANGTAPPATNGAEPKAKRMNPMKRKHMEDRLKELERKIAETESTIADSETGLQNFVSAEETQRVGQLLTESKESLQALMAEWEELSGALETTA
jgi:ATP-binding cassette subfamily F protein 3